MFTSGGTESNNLAIIGTALANQRAGRHIITTSVEHASVKNTMRFLEEEGFEITYLPVDANGEISLEDLKRELREDTILVSMMMVNNEIGALEPIENAGEIIKNHNPADSISCGCDPGIWKVPDHSETDAYRSAFCQRTQDSWTERHWIFIY